MDLQLFWKAVQIVKQPGCLSHRKPNDRGAASP